MRIKISENYSSIRNRQEAEHVCGKIVAMIVAERGLKADLDEAKTKLLKSYEAKLVPLGENIAELTQVLRDWADGSPDEFAGKKSLEMLHAVVGWRTGQPALKTLAGWTWDRVKEKLQGMGRYIREKCEVDKEGIIADRETLGADGLKQLGCRVVQAECFYVDPKISAETARVTAEAV